MELFNKINLDTPSNDDELIKKYDYIKFLKNEKAFEKSGKLNLFYEESKSIGLMHAKECIPSQFIAQLPQIPSRQDLLNDKVESCLSLI